jgi:hypothetical protein
MAIAMHDLRRAVLEALGQTYKEENYYKLPAELSTHPGFIRWRSYIVKVLSTKEARALRPKGTRPHRIFVWDALCDKWQYAGKYCQHCRSSKKHGELAKQQQKHRGGEVA